MASVSCASPAAGQAPHSPEPFFFSSACTTRGYQTPPASRQLHRPPDARPLPPRHTAPIQSALRRLALLPMRPPSTDRIPRHPRSQLAPVPSLLSPARLLQMLVGLASSLDLALPVRLALTLPRFSFSL